MRSQKLDISLVEYAFKNNCERQLWVYAIMRMLGAQRAGYSTIEEIHPRLGVSLRQTQRHIASLIKLGWIEKKNKKYKIISIERITRALDLSSRICVEIGEQELSSFKKFQKYIFAAKLKQCVNTQKRYVKKNSQQHLCGAVEADSDMASPVYQHKANQLAVSLIAKFFGCSVFKAHQLKHMCQDEGLIRFNSEFDIIPFYRVGKEVYNYGIYKHKLPDGSVVWIKRRSDLIYSDVILTKRYKRRINSCVYEAPLTGASSGLEFDSQTTISHIE